MKVRVRRCIRFQNGLNYLPLIAKNMVDITVMVTKTMLYNASSATATHRKAKKNDRNSSNMIER